jgi:outer membrane protein TolC
MDSEIHISARPDGAPRSRLPAALLLGVVAALPWVSVGAEPVAVATLVAEALARNPEIRAARLEHDAAQARRAPAGALDDPMLEAGVVNAALPFSLRREDMTMQMLSISQKLPFPGKRRLREAAASADADAVGFAVSETTNRVVRDVRVAYEDLLLADRTSQIVTHTWDALRSLAAITTSRYAVGRSRQSDVLQAGTRSAEFVQDIFRIRTERAIAESELRRLSGRADERPILPTRSPIGMAATTPSQAIQRPQLAALAAMENRGELELALAEHEYFPDVELRLGYGHRERSLDGLPRDDVVTMTLAVNLPLWRKDRLAPRVAEARALRARAAAMAEQQRLETRAGLEQQAARVRQARDTLALLHSTLQPQAHAAAESARVAWESGAGDFASVMDATMREYESEIAEANAIAAEARARAEIDFLTGVTADSALRPGDQP